MKRFIYFILMLCLPQWLWAQTADVTVAVATPGTLSELIAQQAGSLDNVGSLTVSGTLNDADMSVITHDLTAMTRLNMQGISNETFASTFRNNRVLQSVVLPNGLTELTGNMFYSCTSLQNVTLPAALRTIAMQAFYGCSSLTAISLPSGLQSIGDWAFQDCKKLTSVVLPEGLTSLGSSVFSGCTSLATVTLPSTLAVISDGTFKNTGKLTSIHLPEGLQEIGADAFRGAFAKDAQVSLTMPSTLRIVGSYAFYEQPVASVSLNEGLRELRASCFSYTPLTEVTIPSTVTYVREPFYNCTQLQRITMLPIAPPACYGYYFMSVRGSDMADRTLVVPSATKESYQRLKGFDNFGIYETHDQLPPQFYIVSDVTISTPMSADWHPDVIIDNDKNNGSSENNGFGTLTVMPTEGTMLSARRLQLLYDSENEEWNKFRWHDARRNPYGTVSTGYSKNFSSIVTQADMRADEIVVDVTFNASRWQTFSLPFDCKLSDIESLTSDTYFSIREYDGNARAAGNMAETWRSQSSGEILQAGHGYMIMGVSLVQGYNVSEQPFTLRFRSLNNANKNNLFATADVTVALSDNAAEFEHNRGWNLVGNPYPCYVNSAQTSLSVPFTIWNSYDKKYVSLRQPDDVYAFSPFEAFFVQCSEAQPDITFLTAGRQISRTIVPAAARCTSETGALRRVMNIILEQDGRQDQTRLVVNADATIGYEPDKDALKMRAADSNASLLYTLQDGMEYAINERPFDNGKVLLGMMLGSDSPCSLSLANAVTGSVWLTDNLRGITVKLDADGYTFTAQPGTINDRFVLSFESETTGIATLSATASPQVGTTFSLQGLPSEAKAKGIYIRNGKKIIVK